MIKEPLLSFDEKIDFIKKIVNKYDDRGWQTQHYKIIKVVSKSSVISSK
jgi:hypothetical protein